VAQFVGGAAHDRGAVVHHALRLLAALPRPMRERVLRDSPPAMSSLTQTWRERAAIRRTTDSPRASPLGISRCCVGTARRLRRGRLPDVRRPESLVVASVRQWSRNLDGTGDVGSLPYWPSSPSSVRSATSLSPPRSGRTASPSRVISFIFADLVTLPCCSFYRRFYARGPRFDSSPLLFVMTRAGSSSTGSFISRRGAQFDHTRFASGNFALGWTLALNIVATGVLVTLWFLARNSRHSTSVATDPILRMGGHTSPPGRTRVTLEHVDYYFCSPRMSRPRRSALMLRVIDVSRWRRQWIRC